jgi:hypothetical protein
MKMLIILGLSIILMENNDEGSSTYDVTVKVVTFFP